MTDKEKIVEIISTVSHSPYKCEVGIAYPIGVQDAIIANALIANGIGDITAEKARADRAESALKIIARAFYMYNICSYQECEADDITEKFLSFDNEIKFIEYAKQQADKEGE